MITEKLIQGALPSSGVESSQLSLRGSPGLGGADKVNEMNFGDLFRSTLGEVNELEQQARVAVDGLMRGTGVDVHQALIAAEKANAAFELVLAVRNKAIQSYQSVMSMQF